MSATSARPPSSPAASSRSRAAPTSGTTVADSRPPSAAATASSQPGSTSRSSASERRDGARVDAEEVVGLSQLRADIGGCATRRVGALLARAAGVAGHFARRVGLAQRGAALLDERPELIDARGGRCACPLEVRELALERAGALRVEVRELCFQRLDPRDAARVGHVLGRAGAQQLELPCAPLGAFGDLFGRLAGALQAQLDALGGAACLLNAAGERLAPLAAPRQRLLGRLAAGRDGRQPLLGLRAHATGVGRRGLRLGQLFATGAQLVAGELPARLRALALEPLVQLRGFGLALERPQP